MLRKITVLTNLFNVLILLLIFSINKTLANELPIKTNCEEKNCCKRNEDVKFNIEKLLNEIKKGSMSPQEEACCYHQIAIEYYFVEELKSIEFNKKAETIRLKFNDGLLWMTYRNLAFNYYNIDDYQWAKKYMEMALNEDSEKRPVDLITIYQSLGEYYAYLGDFETANRYINKSLSTNIDEKEKISAYNIKSKILFESKDSLNVKNSIQFAEKALALSDLNNDQFDNKSTALNNIANAHGFLGNFDKSISYFKKIIKTVKDNDFRMGLLLNNVAIQYHNQNRYIKSNKIIRQSIELYENYFDLDYSYWYSAPRENLADNYTSLQQFDTAIIHYQKALINLANNFRNEDVFQNPNSKDTNLFIYSNPDMIRVLHLKATAAHRYFLQNNDIQYLNLANQTYQTAFNFHDKLQKDISTENSRLFQAKNIVPYIENALKVVYELQKNEQDVGESSFRFMEKNKATVLLQAMNEADALRFSNLPDSLVKQEKELKTTITFYERQLNDAKLNEDTISVVSKLENTLFVNKENYSSLINNLEENHPNYYRLKYQQNQNQLTDVQNQLNNETALISYFVGDSSIYTLLIQKDNSQLFKIQKPNNWEEVIMNFRETITLSNINDRLNKYNIESFKKFATHAQSLYQYLLQKPLNELHHISHLKIIPDAELNYIPFDLLLTNSIDTSTVNYKNLPYLVKQKAISYAYSFALLLEQQQTNSIKKDYVYGGYAPKYDNSSYSDLLEARQLVSNMASFFRGKEYINKAATKVNFLNDDSDYQVLHLAMHGMLDDQYPLNSHLIFSKNTKEVKEEDYQLYAADLYTHQLKADLVILNACQTGTGDLQKGEGIMSLSRAFTYSGCPSLIMSLWNIEEYNYSEILETFLKKIKEGNSKGTALRKAKLNYLDKAPNIYSHPYYWAGLVLSGNAKVMKFENSLSKYWWLGGLLLVLFSGYLLYKNNKRNRLLSVKI